MKMIKWDEKNKELHLKIEDEDDLWILDTIIEKDDEVYAKTTREIKIGNEGVRKYMQIGIRVEKVEFQPFTNRLRINGVIIYHPEEYENYGFLGSYHTINIKASDEIKIIKSKWTKTIIKQIEEKCKIKGENRNVLIIAIDDEEAAIGVIREYGIDIQFEVQIKLPSKREEKMREEKIEKVISEIARKVIEIIEKNHMKTIVVVGINYLREKLTSEISKETQKIKNKIILISEDTSNGGIRGINEALRKNSILKALKEIKMIEDSKIMEKYLEILAKEKGKATYGLNETYKAAKMGAVKTLMLSNRILKSYGEKREKIEEIIENVEKHGGEIRIISEISEAGKKLLSLGGIAAILRYKMEE